MDRSSRTTGSWFADTPLGRHVLEIETAVLNHVLPPLFGFHLVQIGGLGNGALLQSSRISHRCQVLTEEDTAPSTGCVLYAAAAQLPFASDSIDVLVLPHVLEYAAQPHAILHEAERILIADGHLVLIGFNPYSWYGLWRKLWARRKMPPWQGQFIGINRAKDWLSLLGFELVSQHYRLFAPPFANQKLRKSCVFMESVGTRWLPQLSGVYILVAQKRRLIMPALRPSRVLRSQPKRLLGTAEPTARREEP